MVNVFKDLPRSVQWSLLAEAATRTAQAEGYTLTRQPGRGRSNVWATKKDGRTGSAAIRTTRDRSIAFPLSSEGRWKTLDQVDAVFVAAVDRLEDPRKI